MKYWAIRLQAFCWELTLSRPSRAGLAEIFPAPVQELGRHIPLDWKSGLAEAASWENRTASNCFCVESSFVFVWKLQLLFPCRFRACVVPVLFFRLYIRKLTVQESTHHLHERYEGHKGLKKPLNTGESLDVKLASTPIPTVKRTYLFSIHAHPEWLRFH